MVNRHDNGSAHQKAVRRWHGIGPRPIGQEAGDLIVEFLLIGPGPEQIAVVSSQHPMPAGHAWIYSKAASKPAAWRAVVQASTPSRQEEEEQLSKELWHDFYLLRRS